MAKGIKTGGRKKGSKNKVCADVRAVARLYTDDAIKTLVKIMLKGKSEAAKAMAAERLLDRGWGKASQPVRNDDDGPLVVELVRFAEDSAAG